MQITWGVFSFLLLFHLIDEQEINKPVKETVLAWECILWLLVGILQKNQVFSISVMMKTIPDNLKKGLL